MIDGIFALGVNLQYFSDKNGSVCLTDERYIFFQVKPVRIEILLRKS
jgi:hypothetical protein